MDMKQSLPLIFARSSSKILRCFSLFADGWESRWHHSSWKEADGTAGKFTKAAGKWTGGDSDNGGIQTGPDSKFFAIYSELAKPFDNKGKDLVLQYSVKHEQDLDCGGGYIKLLPASRCAFVRLVS